MNKRERIHAAIRGEEVDRIPYAFWTHLPGIDLDPQLLAEETWNFARKYDVDFIKMMNNGMYAIEDYGCEIDYSDIKNGGVAKITSTPVEKYDDWGKIGEVPLEKGALAREIRSLENLLAKTRGSNIPVIFTAFSPLTTAQKLCGGKLVEQVRHGQTKLVHQALEGIAATTSNLVRKVLETGADGIFFATQLSSYDIMTEEEYEEFGKPYDMKVLSAAKEGWFNVLHMHGLNVMFDMLKEYPVQVLNWHVWETEPEIGEARKRTGKCIMGGINRYSVTKKDRDALDDQIGGAIRQSKGKGHILTPGCVIRYPLDEETLRYVEIAKERIEKQVLNITI